MSGLAGLSCVLCGAGSTRVGEHVWPAWLIGDFRDQGPFETHKSGVAYTARDSADPLKLGGLPGVHVPMCEKCNAALNTGIEGPAKEVVRSLLPLDPGHSWPTVSAVDVQALALWLLKVGLLSAHPDAVHDLPQVNRDSAFPRLSPFLSEWTSWMNAGSAPPDGFSIYLTRRAERGDVEIEGARRLLILPRVIVDGVDLRFVQRSFGMRGLNVTIVWHPGWEIRNTQVEEGRAALIWPNSPQIDLAALPEVNPREFRVMDSPFHEIVKTRAEFDLLARSPLSHETNLFALMGLDAAD